MPNTKYTKPTIITGSFSNIKFKFVYKIANNILVKSIIINGIYSNYFSLIKENNIPQITVGENLYGNIIRFDIKNTDHKIYLTLNGGFIIKNANKSFEDDKIILNNFVNELNKFDIIKDDETKSIELNRFKYVMPDYILRNVNLIQRFCKSRLKKMKLNSYILSLVKEYLNPKSPSIKYIVKNFDVKKKRKYILYINKNKVLKKFTLK